MNLVLKSKKGTHYATAEFDGETIIVKKGSTIFPEVTYDKLPQYIQDYRNDNELVSKDFITLKDISFNSPTAAANFVTGRSVNGYIAWRIDDKISLKAYKNKE